MRFTLFSKRQILVASKVKGFADHNCKLDENCRKFSKWVANTVGEGKEKLLVTSNVSFSYCVFKRLVLQTRKDQGLSWKGLEYTGI